MAMYGKSAGKKPAKAGNAGGAVRGLDRARAVGGQALAKGKAKKPKGAR